MQSSDKVESAFKHELSSYTSAFFGSSLLLWEADKPVLDDAIWKACECNVLAYIPNDGIQHVLDGGEILYHILWSRGCTYRDICHQYIEYAARKYRNAIIVFDGYVSTSTKGMTQKR